jgi:hypothetical protein
MAEVETVEVQTENGPVRVNKEDAHKWESKPAPKKRARKKAEKAD